MWKVKTALGNKENKNKPKINQKHVEIEKGIQRELKRRLAKTRKTNEEETRRSGPNVLLPLNGPTCRSLLHRQGL